MNTELIETRQATPETLLQTAVENKMGPAELRELTELYKDWERMRATRAFAEAMKAAQEEMPVVVQDALNTQTKSRYALQETIQKKCKPIALKHGFSLSYGEQDVPEAGWKKTICDVTHTEGHTKQYELKLPIDGVGPKGNPIGGMNAVQGCISTTSYGQRRLFCMIFNITIAGEDTDGTAYISADEIEELNKLFELYEADLPLFLQWAGGIEHIGHLPAPKFKEAVALIKQKPLRAT